jgi:hypothetical protein
VAGAGRLVGSKAGRLERRIAELGYAVDDLVFRHPWSAAGGRLGHSHEGRK